MVGVLLHHTKLEYRLMFYLHFFFMMATVFMLIQVNITDTVKTQLTIQNEEEVMITINQIAREKDDNNNYEMVQILEESDDRETSNSSNEEEGETADVSLLLEEVNEDGEESVFKIMCTSSNISFLFVMFFSGFTLGEN